MKVNPNLLSSYPKRGISLITFGTTGTDCDSKVDNNKVKTILINSQLRKLLEESAYFCSKKTRTEESRCRYKSMKTYSKIQPTMMNATQSLCWTIRTKSIFFAKVMILLWFWIYLDKLLHCLIIINFWKFYLCTLK